MSPGALVKVKASKSEATTFTTSLLELSIYLKSSLKSCKTPFLSGVWTITPKNYYGRWVFKNYSYFPTMTSIFKNLAFVKMTA